MKRKKTERKQKEKPEHVKEKTKRNKIRKRKISYKKNKSIFLHILGKIHVKPSVQSFKIHHDAFKNYISSHKRQKSIFSFFKY